MKPNEVLTSFEGGDIVGKHELFFDFFAKFPSKAPSRTFRNFFKLVEHRERLILL